MAFFIGFDAVVAHVVDDLVIHLAFGIADEAVHHPVVLLVEVGQQGAVYHIQHGVHAHAEVDVVVVDYDACRWVLGEQYAIFGLCNELYG